MRAPTALLIAVPAAFAAFAALAGSAAPFVACSSNGNAAASDASVGALQPLGSPCDSTLANPCALAPTACSVNVCTAGTCQQILVSDPSCGDTGALPPPNALCATSADCEAGVCGFLSGAGCNVTGVCVVPVADASLPSPACGCDGLPDPYIASGFASAPASSASACVDGGLDDGSSPDAESADDASSSADSAADAAPGHDAGAPDAADAADGA
jgi:hypothetical protein